MSVYEIHSSIVSVGSVTSVTTPAFTIPANANRAAMLCLSIGLNSGVTGGISGSVSGGGSAAAVAGTDTGAAQAAARTLIFGQTNPASGSQTATMSWTGAATVFLGVVVASGVAQVTSFAGGGFGNGATTGAFSKAATSTSSELSVGVHCLNDPNSGANTPLGTERWNGHDTGFVVFAAGSTRTALNATHGWTMIDPTNTQWTLSVATFADAAVATTNFQGRRTMGPGNHATRVGGPSGGRRRAKAYLTLASNDITGDGALTTGGAAIAATGEEAFAGSGGLTTGGAALAASAQEIFSGTAGLTTAGAATVGAAEEIFSGPGSLTTAGAAITAAAEEIFSGGAALVSGGGAISATAEEAFAATAALATGGAQLAAAGQEIFSATGTMATGGAAIAGVGDTPLSFVGTGALEAGGAAIAAAGEEAFSGAASLQPGGASIAAEGTTPVDIVATGAIAAGGASLFGAAFAEQLVQPDTGGAAPPRRRPQPDPIADLATRRESVAPTSRAAPEAEETGVNAGEDPSSAEGASPPATTIYDLPRAAREAPPEPRPQETVPVDEGPEDDAVGADVVAIEELLATLPDLPAAREVRSKPSLEEPGLAVAPLQEAANAPLVEPDEAVRHGDLNLPPDVSTASASVQLDEEDELLALLLCAVAAATAR